MKVLVLIIFIGVFAIGCYYLNETTIREVRMKQSEVNAKVAGLRFSVKEKELIIKGLLATLENYNNTVTTWDKLKAKGLINLHDYYDIVDRVVRLTNEIGKLVVEVGIDKEMIKHYEKFESR